MSKQSFKGTLNFNHVDPHFARFIMQPESGKKDVSAMVGNRSFEITPGIFPKDFELAKYDVSGTFEFVVEVKEKKA